MFGKKLPVKNMPPQMYEEQQFSEAESEPMYQEHDQTYEPTEKQIREYAINTLGMKLPEDQNLLYLAREGLKAPLLANWVPFQSRHGEIYYKHNKTQQKTEDHPTDTEYRKKYEQIKQKAARKNLKSISMKQNIGISSLLPNNNLGNPMGMGLMNNSSGFGISNASNLSMGEQQITINEELLQQLQRDFSEFQKKKEREWNEMQRELNNDHEKKLKKMKEEHEQQRGQILRGPTSKKGQQKQIQDHKKKLERELEQFQENSLKEELKMIQREEEGKLEQYKQVYEEDNSIKLRKIQQELQQSYQQKSKSLQQKIQKNIQKRKAEKEIRNKKLREKREQFQNPTNPQINKQLLQKVENDIQQIKKQYKTKIIKKQEQYESKQIQIKKLLGVDRSQNLLIVGAKKQKLLSIAKLKIEATKSRQTQKLHQQYQQAFGREVKRLKAELEKLFEAQIQRKKKDQQDKYEKYKFQTDKELEQKFHLVTEEMYQNITISKNSYLTSMNKRMSDFRMKAINSISQQTEKKTSSVCEKLILTEKEVQVANKQEIIKNLQKQLSIEKNNLKIVEFQAGVGQKFVSIGNSNDLTLFLKSKVKSLNIAYKSSQIIQYNENLDMLTKKYKQDKKLLVKILRGIQDSTAFSIQQMKKNGYDEYAGSGSAQLIKKYNQDVRRMRENEEMLNNLERLIKIVDQGGSNYQENIEKLRNFIANQLEYKQIVLKAQLEKNIERQPNISSYYSTNEGHNKKLEQLNMPKNNETVNISKLQQQKWTSSTGSNISTVDQALRQHSQFLSTVKNELNKKLYKIRYENRY